jgi:hypothetical protein
MCSEGKLFPRSVCSSFPHPYVIRFVEMIQCPVLRTVCPTSGQPNSSATCLRRSRQVLHDAANSQAQTSRSRSSAGAFSSPDAVFGGNNERQPISRRSEVTLNVERAVAGISAGFRYPFRHSAFRIPHSALRVPHSAFRTPHSALRIRMRGDYRERAPGNPVKRYRATISSGSKARS